MTYLQFKDHLATFLWKQNDADLIKSLDSLIKMANASLNRELRHERRHVSAPLPATSLDVPLPSDYYTMKSLADSTQKRGEFEYDDPSFIISLRDKTDNRSVLPVYSLQDKTLMLVGPISEDTPLDLIIHYQTTIPDFANTDASWLADDMLDLYTYAVLKHTAPFLREDERVQMWQALYSEALLASNEDSAHNMALGQINAQRLPRQAGVLRRGDRSRTGKLYS